MARDLSHVARNLCHVSRGLSHVPHSIIQVDCPENTLSRHPFRPVQPFFCLNSSTIWCRININRERLKAEPKFVPFLSLTYVHFPSKIPGRFVTPCTRFKLWDRITFVQKID